MTIEENMIQLFKEWVEEKYEDYIKGSEDEEGSRSSLFGFREFLIDELNKSVGK